jgi:hypothetical protein
MLAREEGEDTVTGDGARGMGPLVIARAVNILKT